MKKENSSQTENKGVNHGTKQTEGTKKTVQKRSSGAKGKSSTGKKPAKTASRSSAKPAAVRKGKKSASKLKIIPLGGLEQIGMNITAFEYEESIVVVYCG